MSGGFDYAKAYKDYGAGKYSDADFERYVDSRGDLSGAWDLVNTYRQGGDMSKFPMHGHMTPEQQAEYWINRGATSKAAFGRSHAAEDAALYGGTYSGGRSGRTDIMPGTQAYEDYFGGREGTTFEEYMGGLLNNGSLGRERTDSALGAAAADASMTAPPFYHTGGGSPGDRNYPILPSAPYEAPGLLAGLPASYSPWVQPSNIPDSLWNYQPPELVDWDMSNRVPWGWANRPISDFVASRERTGNRSDGESDGNQEDGNPMNNPANYMPGHEGDPAYYTGPDLNWDASASRKNFDWNNPLGAWANKNIYGMEDANAMAALIDAMQTDPANKQAYMDKIDAMYSGTGVDIGETDIDPYAGMEYGE